MRRLWPNGGFRSKNKGRKKEKKKEKELSTARQRRGQLLKGRNLQY
jgi:hypothetical protein